MFAIEPSIESLFTAALKAGWDRESILLAIINSAISNAEKIQSPSRMMHS
ncbi:hypothetical protein [Rhizobium miluonense]|uniref:Uncharacterized protein n=1 Tax=Rhizobium miluonense TaxID=411945 RepID=A0A1C3V048_9HYPH|nr:hypothetical protein [Rhizobium miluonense]SCB21029.1 hypothetical protein GA0061102_100788 [Rhizobium miluonense]